MPFMPAWFPTREQNTFLFHPTGQAQQFEIPDDARALLITLIGPGGNGGNGFSGAAASARGGGGGGSCGARTAITVPVLSLPRTLWVSPGLRGGGNVSFIGIGPTSSAATNIGLATGGNNGGNGTVSSAGAAGTVPAASTLANALYSWLGTHEYSPGLIGAAGGVHTGAVGGSVSWGTLPISAGAGGAGVTAADFAGGAITGSGIIPTIPGGLAGSNNGSPGYWRPDLMVGTGGSGGGSSNTGVGGNGGDAGGPGCGGGGGGGGITGGTGGRGGNGLIFIQALS